MSERNIILMCEQPPTCPTCGLRLEVGATAVDADADGPIFPATCPDHGLFLVQDDPEHDEESEEDEE